EFSFELVLHHVRLRDSHQSADSRLGDMHCFTDGVDLFGHLNLSHPRQQWITIPDLDMRMPILDMSREFALEVKRTFGRTRIQTDPKGHELSGREKFIQCPAQAVDVLYPLNTAVLDDLFIGETPARPDLLLNIGLLYEQA